MLCPIEWGVYLYLLDWVIADGGELICFMGFIHAMHAADISLAVPELVSDQCK